MPITEFCNIGLNESNEFSKFLNSVLSQELYRKRIKWVKDEKLYRFSAHKEPKNRPIRWQLKNRASRKVVLEMWDKEKKRITAYKHLAFKTRNIYSNERWFITITPTWTFTWNGFQKIFQSRQAIDRN